MNRQRLAFALLVLAMGAAASYAAIAHEEAEPSAAEAESKVDWYLQTAANLQALGKDKALLRLRDMAKDQEQNDQAQVGKVIVLCRMLFVPRPGSEFRGPHLGRAVFMGNTTYADWLLEPIALVDGVPFVITWGYSLKGRAEPPTAYLDYSTRECDWSSVRFTPKSMTEKCRALDKLLSSPKWKTSLSGYERAFLAAQIK